MSTRSATIIREQRYTYSRNDDGYLERDGTELKEIARFYRHCDGYPDGHGAEMATCFCKTADWDGYCWVQKLFGPFMTGMNKEGTEFEGWGAPRIEFEPPDSQHGDLEYLYAVTKYIGGKVEMSVWSIGWDEGYGQAMAKEPLFAGTPPEYLAWIAKR